MRFERYDCYKDSGLEWLGEIPREWGVERLKDLGYLQNGLSKSGSYFGFGFPFVSYGNIHKNAMDLKDIKGLANATEEDQKKYSVLESDIFFTRTSETVDEIGFSATCLKTIPKATFSGFVIRFRPRFDDLYKLYAKYLFRVHDNRHYFIKNMNIVTRASLNQGLLGELPTLIPPLKTQTKIATYLDRKTQKIDKEITLLEQKIEKYRELKQTLINETVLRGLDKNIKFETKRLKDILYLSTGNSIANKEDYEKNDIKVYSYISTKDINIDTNEINYKNGIYIPQNNNAFKILKEETTLLCIEGASAGKKIGFTNQRICLVNKLCAFKSKNNSINDKFIFYNIKSVLFKNQFFAEMGGVIGGVSIGIMRNFIIQLPPLKEQIQIANYLDEKTQKIDNITQTISKKIELLKEFRKTLINDVVTGKVKVS